MSDMFFVPTHPALGFKMILVSFRIRHVHLFSVRVKWNLAGDCGLRHRVAPWRSTWLCIKLSVTDNTGPRLVDLTKHLQTTDTF